MTDYCWWPLFLNTNVQRGRDCLSVANYWMKTVISVTKHAIKTLLYIRLCSYIEPLRYYKPLPFDQTLRKWHTFSCEDYKQAISFLQVRVETDYSDELSSATACLTTSVCFILVFHNDHRKEIKFGTNPWKAVVKMAPVIAQQQR